MFKDENIICISSIDWDFVWQGHQEIMTTFAQNDNRVLFIENTGVRSPTLKDFGRLLQRIKNRHKSIKGYRKIRNNIYLFSPIVLPFPYSKLIGKFNSFILKRSLKRWMSSADFGSPIIWTFLPTGLSIDIINGISHKASIYYCIDNFRESSTAAKKIANSEKEMIRIVDLVFVTSNKLYEYAVKFKTKKNIKLYPFGVNISNFEKVRKSKNKIPDDISQLPHPIIGYIGGVHKWVDQYLIEFLAKQYPDYSYIFVGPIQCDILKLKGIKNIYFLGMKKYTELPHYAKFFSVGIIPYLLTKYTENVYPTKLNEYLIMGKPVVSTSLPEIKHFNENNGNLVYISETKEEFAENLKLSVKNSTSKSNEREKRIKAAENNTWGKRIEEMVDVINNTIEEKKKMEAESWEKRLIKIYLDNRRRFAKWVLVPIMLYFLIFYSPLIRLMANPLIISEPPEKANAIMVIGGGAGESGIPGQGYEDRVKHAVDLYKNGFADNIIYSSGVTSLLKEPDVMKAMSVLLGVPGKDIILDTNSASTYESIIAMQKILKRKAWDKILIVSSPYHMLRTSLVVNKNAPKIKAVFTPIPVSKFYKYNASSPKFQWFNKLTWQQIRGFLHEYFGIIYYWWKGYI